MQTARAAALQATEGFGGEETGRAYSRARELCTELADAPEVFPVLHGVFLFHMLRGEIQLGHDAATECLKRAQSQDDITPLMFGHRTVGSALLHLGKFADAGEHFREMRELTESDHHDPSSSIYGIHPRAAAPAFWSLTLYASGYPSQAKGAALDALSHAQELGQPHNLCYALYWSNLTGIQLRDLEAVRERSERLQSLAHKQGYLQWAAFGTFQQGVALAGLGDVETGIAKIRQGLTEYRVNGSVLYLPFMEALLAVALAGTQHWDEAITMMSDALARAKETHEIWFEAELHRLQGELLRHGAPRKAEFCFQQALDVARGQGAKSWELRTATSLARLYRDQGRHERARELLACVYQWFTEGFETPDLQEAKGLLEELTVA